MEPLKRLLQDRITAKGCPDFWCTKGWKNDAAQRRGL
jgi:hypothetical protein